MGTDIHVWVEGVGEVEAFHERQYGKFAFLAGIRNYSKLPSMPWWGRYLPADASSELREWNEFNHSTTWFRLSELLAFDYSQTMVDHRNRDKEMSFQEFLNATDFFESLVRLQKFGNPLVIISFDS